MHIKAFKSMNTLLFMEQSLVFKTAHRERGREWSRWHYMNCKLAKLLDFFFNICTYQELNFLIYWLLLEKLIIAKWGE